MHSPPHEVLEQGHLSPTAPNQPQLVQNKALAEQPGNGHTKNSIWRQGPGEPQAWSAHTQSQNGKCPELPQRTRKEEEDLTCRAVPGVPSAGGGGGGVSQRWTPCRQQGRGAPLSGRHSSWCSQAHFGLLWPQREKHGLQQAVWPSERPLLPFKNSELSPFKNSEPEGTAGGGSAAPPGPVVLLRPCPHQLRPAITQSTLHRRTPPTRAHKQTLQRHRQHSAKGVLASDRKQAGPGPRHTVLQRAVSMLRPTFSTHQERPALHLGRLLAAESGRSPSAGSCSAGHSPGDSGPRSRRSQPQDVPPPKGKSRHPGPAPQQQKP